MYHRDPRVPRLLGLGLNLPGGVIVWFETLFEVCYFGQICALWLKMHAFIGQTARMARGF